MKIRDVLKEDKRLWDKAFRDWRKHKKENNYEIKTKKTKLRKITKINPTKLTWEEENSADYRYYPTDNSILENFIKKNLKLKGGKEVVQLFKKGYLEKEEIKKLREVFKDMLFEFIEDFDPDNVIINVFKEETGMGRNEYIKEKTDEFIERLSD